MNHERDRREHNRRIAIERNKDGGRKFSLGDKPQGPGEYSVLNGNLVVRKKGSNDPWLTWGNSSGHLKPGQTPHGKLPVNQYSTGPARKATFGGNRYDLSIPSHQTSYLKAAQGADYTVSGVTYDGKTHRPKGAPEGGYSVGQDGKMTSHTKPEPETPEETPAPTPPSSPAPTGPVPTTERTNANGLVSYGKDLSSLNTFTKAFTGGYEIADIKSSFQSNDLPTAYQDGSNNIGYQETPYELPEGSMPSTIGIGGEYTESGKNPFPDTDFKLSDSAKPMTVGSNPTDPQDGTSDKPDTADKVRQIRMRRKGPRDEGSFRGFQIDQANEFAQNSVSETKGNGMSAKRRAIKDAFFNMDLNSVQATVAANAEAHFGKDSNGDPVFNFGGKLVHAKEGMKQQAKNAAMMGQDPTQFLEVPTTPDTQPDTPAVSELSPSFATETPGAQEFFRTEGQKIKPDVALNPSFAAETPGAQEFFKAELKKVKEQNK